MALADVHAHLTHPRFDSERRAVLDRAAQAGVSSVVCNGLNPADNQAVLDLARAEPLVRPALGLYPVDAVLPEMRALGVEYPREGPELPAEECVEWVRAHVDEAFAIGEIGLDGYWVPEPLWERQEQSFVALVQLALEADKPIIIHTRKRERRAFELLVELGAQRVDWHCFGSKAKLARQIAGSTEHYFSIPANARRSESFTRMIESLPRDRLLLETDCPYLGPDRERVNEPANVAGTAAYIAELWREPLGAVQAQLAENFVRLFGVEP